MYNQAVIFEHGISNVVNKDIQRCHSFPRNLKVYKISIYEIYFLFLHEMRLYLMPALVTNIQAMFVLKGQRLQRNAVQQT